MKLLIKAASTVTRIYSSRYHEFCRYEIKRHSLPLDVEPTLTIGALKTLLKPHRWIPKKNLLLVHPDKPLNDDRATLRECLVKDMDTLLVCKGGSYLLNVHYCFSEPRYHILISSCLETVRDIMNKIHLVMGIHPDNQILKYGRRDLNDKGAHLVTLGVVPNKIGKTKSISVILKKIEFLEKPASDSLPAKFLSHMEYLTSHTGSLINIFVEKPHFCCMSLYVKPTDTIDTLKTAITDITDVHLEDDGSIDEDHLSFMRRTQSLVHGHKLLVNGSATMVEYGIKEHDVIQMCDTRCFEIYVCWAAPDCGNNAESPGIKIEVICFDTVQGLKEKIREKTGIPAPKQNLMLYGMSLDNDGWCLLDYGIAHDSYRNCKDVVMLNLKENHSP